MVVVARWQWMGGRVGGRLSASGWAHPEGEDGMPEDLQLERLDLLLRHALQPLEGVDGCHDGGQGGGALEQAARCCSGHARVSQSARFDGRDARAAGEGGGGGDDWCWRTSMAGGGVGGARSSS